MIFDRFWIFPALFILFVVLEEPALALKKSYVVFLGGHSHGGEFTEADLNMATESHIELLSSFLGSTENAKEAMIYSYRRYINGFSALLEEEEAAKIAEHPDVVSVFPNRAKKLHTTHSWDFLRLENGGVTPPSSIWSKAGYGEDTIIANLDSGVWPESKSFTGKEYGPIPSKWRGTCHLYDKAGRPICNRKLIGARHFNKGYLAYLGNNGTCNSCSTPRDYEGHGTHTLSTAGGNFVPGESVFGAGNGTAKGGSPRARVASYKVCYPAINGGECMDSDIMKGFETAIHDGVDVLSVSLGGPPADYFDDSIALSSFHAVKEGMVVVASAGNSGPRTWSVSNAAPWIITVGASTLDRLFEAKVELASGVVFKGRSLSEAMPQGKLYPIISAAQAPAANVNAHDSIFCKNNTLDPEKVKGKIVLCLRGLNVTRVEKGAEALRAGTAGMVLCNGHDDGNEIIADSHLLPTSHVTYIDGRILFDYVNHTKNPRGIIAPPTAVLNHKPVPYMAPFSSRGPNVASPEILKPDITAPGVNIIASYSEATSPTETPYDHRTTPFYVESGTSMACPHVSGVVGLLKTVYPHWTAGAIRSAIMTSARTRDSTVTAMKDYNFREATPLAYGSGNIRPNRAMDPGLVYDVTTSDYLDFLCGLGYNQTMIRLFSGTPHECPDNYSTLNFNNPSFFFYNMNRSVTVSRAVKNVDEPGTYTTRIRSPKGYLVSVEPNSLKFDSIGEERTYTLTLTPTTHRKGYYGIGHLTWTDGTHYVRSPIMVYRDQ